MQKGAYVQTFDFNIHVIMHMGSSGDEALSCQTAQMLFAQRSER
jgi:hypothetical protein